jgi:hypothetical protein
VVDDELYAMVMEIAVDLLVGLHKEVLKHVGTE